MEAGKATQTITDLHLVMDDKGETLSLSEATHAGVEQLQAYEPKDEDDAARKDKYLEELPLVIRTRHQRPARGYGKREPYPG